MRTNNEKNNAIWLILGFAAISYLVIIVFYIGNFFSLQLSKNISDWGQLGDYIGGILNPAFSFFTLIVVLKNYKEEQDRSIDQKADMQKQEQEKIVSFYVRYLERSEENLDEQITKTKPYFRPYNTIYASSNQRRSGGHPVFWDLTDRWNLYLKFYNKILEINLTNPVLEYMSEKYKDVKRELLELGYINGEEK